MCRKLQLSSGWLGGCWVQQEGLRLPICRCSVDPARSLEAIQGWANQGSRGVEEDQAGVKLRLEIDVVGSWRSGFNDCVSKLQINLSSLCFQACSEFETSRSKAISENTAAITAAETTAATLKGELADVKQLLLQTKNTLRDDSSLESTAVVLSLESTAVFKSCCSEYILGRIPNSPKKHHPFFMFSLRHPK